MVKLNGDSIIKYLGYLVLVVFALYFVMKLSNLQLSFVDNLLENSYGNQYSGIKEGFAGLDKLNENLKEAVQSNNDKLLIDKYRSDYEDRIINMEELINQNILRVLNYISTEKEGPSRFNTFSKEAIEKTIPFLNELYKLRDNLNSTMDYLDSK